MKYREYYYSQKEKVAVQKNANNHDNSYYA